METINKIDDESLEIVNTQKQIVRKDMLEENLRVTNQEIERLNQQKTKIEDLLKNFK